MIDLPTAASMKMRFKQFVRFDDAEIEFAIEEAKVACGETAAETNSDWLDDLNLILAIQYYAAHVLQMTLQRTSSGSGMMKASESTPELSVSYTTPPWPTADQITDFNQTMYGMRFKALLRKNFPAIIVANSAIGF
jgi:uncharacterized protein DUF4054